ncbi:MAG: hypothetical protein ACTSW4_03905 [Candidatus Ranarchaeia archaeon]
MGISYVKTAIRLIVYSFSCGLAAFLTILNGLSLVGFGFLGFHFGFPFLGAITYALGLVLVIWGVYGLSRARQLWAMDRHTWKCLVFWLICDLILSIISAAYPTVILGIVILIYIYSKRKNLV